MGLPVVFYPLLDRLGHSRAFKTNCISIFNNFSTTKPILDLNVSVDKAHKDLKLRLKKESPSFDKFKLFATISINKLLHTYAVTPNLL